MHIYYIRHAQSANNKLYAESGSEKGRSEDAVLTELGVKQANLMAKHIAEGSRGAEPPVGQFDLHEYRLTHIYSSLMTRALQTASFLAAEINLPLIGRTDLHEVGGVYLEDEESSELIGRPGKTPTELGREFPALILPEGLPETGWYSRPFETREERFPRVKALLEDLLARHAGTSDRIALVSHGGLFQYFVTSILGLTERLPVWFVINNASITRIDFDDRFEIAYMNRTPHLSAELLT